MLNFTHWAPEGQPAWKAHTSCPWQFAARTCEQKYPNRSLKDMKGPKLGTGMPAAWAGQNSEPMLQPRHHSPAQPSPWLPSRLHISKLKTPIPRTFLMQGAPADHCQPQPIGKHGHQGSLDSRDWTVGLKVQGLERLLHNTTLKPIQSASQHCYCLLHSKGPFLFVSRCTCHTHTP